MGTWIRAQQGAAIALALGAQTARAEDAAPAPSSASAAAPEPVEVVVTGTRTPESSQRATVHTQVISRAEAERRGATNVGEALSQQLGVQVNPSSYGNLGRPSAIQIQGFDRDRVLVLEDGERVIGDIGGAIDLSTLPLTDVSRIELVTGPTSSLYGTAAIGGVVNVITAPPARFGPSGRVRLEGRSRWGLLAQGNGSYRDDRFWVTGDASIQREDGLALNPRLPDLWLPDRTQTLLGLRAGAPLGSRAELRLRARWLRDAQDGLETEVLPGGSYLVDTPGLTERFGVNASEVIDLGDGSSVRLAVSRQWSSRDSTRDRRNSPEEDVRRQRGTMQSMEGTATIADGPRTWVVGARAEVEFLRQNLSDDIILPSGIETAEVEEVAPTRLGNGALYAQLAWKFGEALTVLPGVRGEMHLRYGGVVAPRLAIAYRPSPALGFRLSGGRGFRAPSGKELGFSFDHAAFGYQVLGNTELRPETSWGVNGDVSLQVDRDIAIRVGAFANRVDSLIDIDVSEPVFVTPAGVEIYEYKNFGEAVTTGVDVQAKVKAGEFLGVEVGYAYLWTRDLTNERPLPSRP
ncbi:MAG TPA: TonB-dependent receptor, partial [Candidatus Nanopelagicales bacterium]|nr:TonB-dependent receptor [Candidatus Nanopelagicales bacterium]